MKCTDQSIKELLAALVRGELNSSEQDRVTAHIGACFDCRSELAALAALAEEAVPDPGEAFWKEMPMMIERAVRHRRQRRGFRRVHFRGFFARISTPRPAWAAALAMISASAALWILARPAPMPLTGGMPANEQVRETIVSGQAVNPVELTAAELAAVGRWAQNEFWRIGSEYSEYTGESRENNAEQDLSEDIMNMSPQELDRFYEMLDKKEQDIRRKIRRESTEENVG